ncbi:hypothetical protein [Streptomyces viridochromogenes]|uniref:hypothetical protein n=1 Tax=Streptomyces viridochromogenes TaxID=1938 RepID=UPI001F29068E|nr:hypothetical protein [Streptomyces viridochromogenes]
MRLKKMAYGHKNEHRLRVRAQVVLHAERGRSDACIVTHASPGRRGSMWAPCAAGVAGSPRRACPGSKTVNAALACRLPAESEGPLSRWSCPGLAREAARRGIAPFMSASTVRRRLAQDALKPWQHPLLDLHHPPGFRLKATWVLDLYARTWQGERLGDDEYVISADEKTSLTPARPGRCASITSTDAAVP